MAATPHRQPRTARPVARRWLPSRVIHSSPDTSLARPDAKRLVAAIHWRAVPIRCRVAHLVVADCGQMGARPAIGERLAGALANAVSLYHLVHVAGIAAARNAV